MADFKTKEHINYYFNEKKQSLKDRFYCAVIFEIFEYYFNIIFQKYNVSEYLKKDLKQELHIHAFNNLKKIQAAKNSNSFLITISKNFTINYLKCQMTNFIPVSNGEALELLNCL